MRNASSQTSSLIRYESVSPSGVRVAALEVTAGLQAPLTRAAGTRSPRRAAHTILVCTRAASAPKPIAGSTLIVKRSIET